MCGHRGPAKPADGPEIHWRDSLNGYLSNDMSVLPAMDAVVDSFMNFWSLRGVSMAVMRKDSLLYARGYGMADASTPMTPGTTLRLASVSKLLTAVGIMRLQEEGKVYMDTPVFGPYGVLNRYDAYIKDANYYLITVEHLLRHQAGFTSRGGDPVFSPYASLDALLRKQLGRTLAYEPGTSQEYSNLGFLLLSLIIEEVSGQPYEQFMQEEVFSPALCRGFSLAGNYLGVTRTIPIAIYFEWMNGNTDIALFWTGVILVFSFIVILFINLWSRRTTKYRRDVVQR